MAVSNPYGKPVLGTSTEQYMKINEENFALVKVANSKRALIWEINDIETQNKIKEITKTGSVSYNNPISEQLSNYPLLKN